MSKPTRDSLLAAFSYQIGGWNATKSSAGRLRGEECYNNDKEIVEFLLNTYERDITKHLILENQKLKAKLYELLCNTKL